MKIHKTVATRAVPFGPDPTGEAYSAPPDPIAGLRGPTSKGGERRGGEWREGKESAPPGPKS